MRFAPYNTVMVRVPGDGWKRRAAAALLDIVEPRYKQLLPPFSMRRFIGEARWDVGGTDFRNNGRHFAEKMRDAGLHSASHVLDIGSGCGRIAIPLTHELGPSGSYTGLELSRPLADWCSANITPRQPNFRFVHSDLKNPMYNPEGRGYPLTYVLPFDHGAFDLIVATSVFTHLLPEIATRYLQQCARVLQPNGRLFATFYFIDDTIQSSESSLRFNHDWGDDARVSDPSHPEAAIGFRVEWILQQARATGLELEPPIRYGTWSGRPDGYSGQDVLILCKTA
jgi:SAM-dependent methyltransferase